MNFKNMKNANIDNIVTIATFYLQMPSGYAHVMFLVNTKPIVLPSDGNDKSQRSEPEKRNKFKTFFFQPTTCL